MGSVKGLITSRLDDLLTEPRLQFPHSPPSPIHPPRWCAVNLADVVWKSGVGAGLGVRWPRSWRSGSSP